uniref:Uncharacterized protein n=1 Tax=Zooxanthella nutricula TaxID=1333877 RepID=A0A6U6QT44_9DINO
MGQAAGQSAPRRLCHTQEIALRPPWPEDVAGGSAVGGVAGGYDERWLGQMETHTLGQWTTSEAAISPPCCANAEGPCIVEEVLVVHHDALRKVNFLLKVDELSGCDLPAIPECVAAARRAEMQRRHHRANQAQSLSADPTAAASSIGGGSVSGAAFREGLAEGMVIPASVATWAAVDGRGVSSRRPPGDVAALSGAVDVEAPFGVGDSGPSDASARRGNWFLPTRNDAGEHAEWSVPGGAFGFVERPSFDDGRDEVRMDHLDSLSLDTYSEVQDTGGLRILDE